jgi:hypothetical protein
MLGRAIKIKATKELKKETLLIEIQEMTRKKLGSDQGRRAQSGVEVWGRIACTVVRVVPPSCRCRIS